MIPYRKVAEKALYEWDYQYSMEDQEAALKRAHEDAETLAFEDLESKVYATGSMNYAIEGIAKYLKEQGVELTPDEIEQYSKAVFEGPENADVLKTVEEKIKTVGEPDKLVVATLSNIHDGWVKDNAKKFTQEGRNKQYQHMPIELIGWKEAKLDLLFLRPILEASGVEINEETLESAYNESVMKYFEDKGITSTADLQALIQQGESFYPSLQGQDSITTLLADSQFVAETVIPKIESKGIGNVEQFISQNKKTLTPADIEVATATVTRAGMDSKTKEIRDEFAPNKEITNDEIGIEQ